MKIKFCGFTEESSLRFAVEQRCDFIGLVFVENSPRKVDLATSSKLERLIPKEISKVAVVVDPDLSRLEAIYENFSPDFFQFHGEEIPSFLVQVKEKFPQIKIIKALKFDNSLTSKKITDFAEIADFYLFDNSTPGSGKKFDWHKFANFLQNFLDKNHEEDIANQLSCKEKPQNGKDSLNQEVLKNGDLRYAYKPWFLSGGINCQNLAEAIKITKPRFIDVSSGIEEIRAVKSPKLILEFMELARNITNLIQNPEIL